MLRLADLSRMLLALCLMLDAIWYILTYHTRVAQAHLAWTGAPVIWLLIITYLLAGFCLFANYHKRYAVTALSSVLLITALLLHTDFHSAGLGEVSAFAWSHLQFLQLLLLVAIVGGVIRTAYDWTTGRWLTAVGFMIIAWWPPAALITILLHSIFAGLLLLRYQPLVTAVGIGGLTSLHAANVLLWQNPGWPQDWQLHLGILHIALLAAAGHHIALDNRPSCKLS